MFLIFIDVIILHGHVHLSLNILQKCCSEHCPLDYSLFPGKETCNRISEFRAGARGNFSLYQMRFQPPITEKTIVLKTCSSPYPRFSHIIIPTTLTQLLLLLLLLFISTYDILKIIHVYTHTHKHTFPIVSSNLLWK